MAKAPSGDKGISHGDKNYTEQREEKYYLKKLLSHTLVVGSHQRCPKQVSSILRVINRVVVVT